MKKSEIFDVVLAMVCEECEVSATDVVEGVKDQTVVDARLLLVQYTRRIGLSNNEIARIVLQRRGEEINQEAVRRKAKCVDKMFKNYSDRCLQCRAFVLMSREINRLCTEVFRTES